jgi:hypothetical protein
LRHEYAIVPEGAVGQTGLFSARGPSYGTERGPSYDTERRWQHQSPSYTLRTVDSTCRLAVLEDGKVSAQWNRNGVHSQKSYDRVSGFIITSRNTSRIGPECGFEIKVVYTAGIYDRSPKTESIWKTQSMCVLPSTRVVRVAFSDWVYERGLFAIDDQYN